mmetsp:Transcript_24331/g.27728  ORF Transcript_24331/g.27728 Transcript_24331/m.27728 type:complete len:620 (+) Transcript_24331:93-1952(+)
MEEEKRTTTSMNAEASVEGEESKNEKQEEEAKQQENDEEKDNDVDDEKNDNFPASINDPRYSGSSHVMFSGSTKKFDGVNDDDNWESSGELHKKLLKVASQRSAVGFTTDDDDDENNTNNNEENDEKDENLIFKRFLLKRDDKATRLIDTKQLRPGLSKRIRSTLHISYNEPKGRMYSSKYAQKPGGICVEDMLYGLNVAHLSCTDDTEERLSNNGPQVIETIKMIINSKIKEKKQRKQQVVEQQRNNENNNGDDENTDENGNFYDSHRLHLLPLSLMLKRYFNLNLDYHIDESGFRSGRPVDTQGFIASNDDTIVLSYRFTTSIYDWMTNLSMGKAEWNPDSDDQLGRAKVCGSCRGGFMGYGPRPRVHIGFYNNFLYTSSYVEKYILEKLRDKSTTPKKVYVVGMSLGAGIATVAFCWLLEKFDWEQSPHKLLCVTAGCPRVCNRLMKKRIQGKLDELRPTDKAKYIRCVYNSDMVTHLPFSIQSYRHLEKLVYITSKGDVIINPRLQPLRQFSEVVALFKSFQKREKSKDGETVKRRESILTAYLSDYRMTKAQGEIEDDESQQATTPEQKLEMAKQAKSLMSLFEEECETTAGPIKDHMSFWYIKHLQNLMAREK